MYHSRAFQCFDRVDYVGNQLSSKLNSKTGTVVAHVKNEPGAYVVEFSNNDAFIVGESSLRRHVNTAKDEKEPEIQLRRKYEDVD